MTHNKRIVLRVNISYREQLVQQRTIVLVATVRRINTLLPERIPVRMMEKQLLPTVLRTNISPLEPRKTRTMARVQTVPNQAHRNTQLLSVALALRIKQQIRYLVIVHPHLLGNSRPPPVAMEILARLEPTLNLPRVLYVLLESIFL
jgi:hypothetical protein